MKNPINGMKLRAMSTTLMRKLVADSIYWLLKPISRLEADTKAVQILLVNNLLRKLQMLPRSIHQERRPKETFKLTQVMKLKQKQVKKLLWIK